MMLTDPIFKAFYPAKLFKEHVLPINSIDYSDSGEFLITASGDDTFFVFDCVSGKKIKLIHSKKYGCENVRFTHSNSCVIHSSKDSGIIRYLSLHDNRYFEYFIGHSGKVLDLVMSPADDTFVSVSEDKSVRIWDLRSKNCQGFSQPNSPPSLVKMDPRGLIYAVSTLRKTILLYDLRSFDKGHFCEFSVPISSCYGPPDPPYIESSSITGFEFTPDGQRVVTLVINESEAVASILDSFDGRVYNCLSTSPPWAYLKAIKNPDICCQKMRINISITPDSRYLMTFIPSRKLECYLQAWKLENGQPISLYDPIVNKSTCQLAEIQDTPYHVCLTKFNPRFMMMATTCDHNLILWQPDQDKTFLG
ncbi:WD repeat-containing protein 82 [Thelohanellus kitauei]|uniref:WD repeat-containing protein 82 n=1 Tax=Thelohanellus kitauei TaxID=669202 RepID=A0A0C2M6V0_THEKT|nr:WD repeat-containing protein 82 [Thelohanellus kitauei]